MLRALFLLGCIGTWFAAAEAASVFDAYPAWPAPFVERLPSPARPTGDILRRLTVEERVGEPRANELVRVPLFLHADEPGDPALWALFAEDDTDRRHPLVFQLDDLRRNESDRLSRCHLYFELSLQPWERRSFVLVAVSTPTPQPAVAPLVCSTSGDTLTVAGDDLSASFTVSGPRTGALTAIATLGKNIAFTGGGAAPALTFVEQAPDCVIGEKFPLSYDESGTFEIRELLSGSGPLFAKLSVRLGPRGSTAEALFSYLVPRHGTVLIQTERLAPTGEPVAGVVGAEDHRILAGRIQFGDDSDGLTTRPVPAGLRRLTRTTNGHFLEALVDHDTGLALLPVPAVQTGGGEISLGRGGAFSIAGPVTFRRNGDANSATLRAFWGEMRYAFTAATDEESLWHLARREYQPLVAIVDEPTLGAADCRAAMPAIAERFLEIKYWGRNWQQDAAILWLHGERAKFDALLARKPPSAETETDYHLPKWARATPPLPRDPKDQGAIDPYHLGYGASLLPLFHRLVPNEKQGATARAIGVASRQVNGRVNDAGWPYVESFATAFNMQIGPLGLALFGARATNDQALASWALDALHNPSVTGLYGHAQRPYPGEIRRAEPSDFLYECISDLHLRSVELSTGEDLWVHPAALGRYFDCVDVTADLQHRSLPDAAGKSWYRANFFRGQAHDHRWENWSAAPLAGLFGRAADRGTIGSTEAAYWLAEQGTRKQPWAELMWFAHTDLLLATAEQNKPPVGGPPLPANPKIERRHSSNTLKWAPVPGAASYRVYRAENMGGPWEWLNSPYGENPATALAATEFVDPDGRESDVYLVTAVDGDGRESRWYPEEPVR